MGGSRGQFFKNPSKKLFCPLSFSDHSGDKNWERWLGWQDKIWGVMGVRLILFFKPFSQFWYL